MLAWIAENWSSILLSLVTAGALGFCGWSKKQIKTYKSILDEKEKTALNELIDEKTAPIEKEIEDLRAYVRKQEQMEEHKFNLIIASYRFRLIQLCKIYLRQGYMTQEQYDQLSEFYTLYTSLGGNGQAKDYYDQVKKLPIRPE